MRRDARHSGDDVLAHGRVAGREGAGGRRRHGVAARHPSAPAAVPRGGEPRGAGGRAGGPRRVHPGRCRRDPDEHLRRERRQARLAPVRAPGGGAERGGGEDRPRSPRDRRPRRADRRIDRPAGHVGRGDRRSDAARSGALRRAGRRAGGPRRRPDHAGDVHLAGGARSGGRRGARPVSPTGGRPDHGAGGWRDGHRLRRRRGGGRPRAAGRDGGRHQLQPRSAVRAGGPARDAANGDDAPDRPAEHRAAAVPGRTGAVSRRVGSLRRRVRRPGARARCAADRRVLRQPVAPHCGDPPRRGRAPTRPIRLQTAGARAHSGSPQEHGLQQTGEAARGRRVGHVGGAGPAEGLEPRAAVRAG